MTSAEIRRKLVAALVRAAGRSLDTPEKAASFLERELDFAVSHTFGGNSSCVQLDAGATTTSCATSAAARASSATTSSPRAGRAATPFHVFMSHVHWDHIMGFPFFMPAYIAGNQHPDLRLPRRARGRLPAPARARRPSRSISRGSAPGSSSCGSSPGASYDDRRAPVTAKLQLHGGDSYGYRFERDGKVVVYSTDSEHKHDELAEAEAFVEFFRDADLVIFDAQYSLAEATSIKEDWGHSSNVVGVELCQMARAKRLCLFHHEPVSDDERDRRAARARRGGSRRSRAATGGVEILAAYDGMEIAL